MVDYSRFIVDPWLGVERGQQTALAQIGQMQQGQAQQQQLALANRRVTMDEKKMAADEEDKKRQLAVQHLKFFADGLAGADSDESLAAFKSFAGQLVQAKMLEPWMVERIPDKYDPKKHKEALKAIQSAYGELEWGEAYQGPRGSRLQKSKKTGEEKAVVGQAPADGGPSGEDKPLTKAQMMAVLDQSYQRVKEGYVDVVTGMERVGPAEDPDRYVRLRQQALEARQKDLDLVQQGEPPHFLKDITHSGARTEEKVSAEREASRMPDPALPANITNPATGKPRILKDSTTGKRYKSDGKKWVEVK